MEHLNILPQIKPFEFIEKGNGKLVYRTLVPNLIVCYVEDGSETMGFISEQRLKELEIDKEQLDSIALKSLSDLENTKSGVRIMDNGDGTKSVSYETHDSYDAARFLLLFSKNLDLLDKFIQILGDPFLVAIPSRDFLLAVPPKYEAKLSAYAHKLFAERPFPITTELFLFSKKEETFKPDK